MTPPINIDGSKVSDVTIDGQDVEQITIDGQVVPSAIPDSAIEQWVSSDYDTNNDEWIGQLNGINLTGGSASVGTGPDGNTVVEYSGSSGQAHTTSSFTSVSYDRWVVGVVYRNQDTSTQSYLFGNKSSSGHGFQTVNDPGSNNNLKLWFGGSDLTGGTPDTELKVAFIFAPQFGSSNTNEFEQNGTTIASGDTGTDPLDEYTLGDSTPSGSYPFNGDVLETVIYDNPTKSDIDGERARLRNAYSGVSF